MIRAASRDDEERAPRHHVVLEVPVGLRRLEQRLRDRQAGVVDDEVDAAEGEHRGVGTPRRPASASVTSAATPSATSVPPSSRGDGLRAVGVDVGDDDARALGGEPVGDRLADPRAGAGDERDPRRRAASASASAASLASSSAQYSIRNFSDFGDRRVGRSASAPRMTLIALT